MVRDETSVAIESPRCVCSLYNGLQIGGRYTSVVLFEVIGFGTIVNEHIY